MVLKKSYAQFTDDSIGNTIHSNSDRKAETRGWIQSNGFPSIKKCLYRTCSKIWCYRGSEDLIQIVINDNGQCTVKWIKRLERVSEWKQAQPSNASWQRQSVQWISRWRWFWRIWEGKREREQERARTRESKCQRSISGVTDRLLKNVPTAKKCTSRTGRPTDGRTHKRSALLLNVIE